jgi:phage gp36-like protein
MSSLTVVEFKAQHTARDIEALFGDLTTGEADAAIALILAEAKEELAGYADSRYETPLADTNQVKRIEGDLAWYTSCRRKDWNYTDSMAAQEKELRRKLESLTARKFNLTEQVERGSVAQSTSNRETTPSARQQGRKREFTRDKMNGF